MSFDESKLSYLRMIIIADIDKTLDLDGITLVDLDDLGRIIGIENLDGPVNESVMMKVLRSIKVSGQLPK